MVFFFKFFQRFHVPAACTDLLVNVVFIVSCVNCTSACRYCLSTTALLSKVIIVRRILCTYLPFGKGAVRGESNRGFATLFIKDIPALCSFAGTFLLSVAHARKWSLGAVVAELVTGNVLLQSESVQVSQYEWVWL